MCNSAPLIILMMLIMSTHQDSNEGPDEETKYTPDDPWSNEQKPDDKDTDVNSAEYQKCISEVEELKKKVAQLEDQKTKLEEKNSKLEEEIKTLKSENENCKTVMNNPNTQKMSSMVKECQDLVKWGKGNVHYSKTFVWEASKENSYPLWWTCEAGVEDEFQGKEPPFYIGSDDVRAEL